MQPVLVKIDVAVVQMHRSVRAIYGMAEGGTRLDKALCWVFDFSRGNRCTRRDLRFWYPELMARGGTDDARRYGYSGFQLEWVIKRILPESRQRFSAGEVSEWLQIRHNTRAALLPADGWANRRAYYLRQTLAGFLRQCWVGGDAAHRLGGQSVGAPTSNGGPAILCMAVHRAAGCNPGALHLSASAEPGATVPAMANAGPAAEIEILS